MTPTTFGQFGRFSPFAYSFFKFFIFKKVNGGTKQGSKSKPCRLTDTLCPPRPKLRRHETSPFSIIGSGGLMTFPRSSLPPTVPTFLFDLAADGPSHSLKEFVFEIR